MSAVCRRWSVVLLFVLVGSRALPARTRHRARPQRSRAEASLDAEAVNDPGTKPTIRPGDSGSAVLRAQILLARVHVSCGEIDGRFGLNMRFSVSAFRQASGLPPDEVVNDDVWDLLNQDSATALIRVPIADSDVAGPFKPIPQDMLEKASLPALDYSSPLEAIAEKYHASPKLLERLNPGVAFDQADTEILVPNVSVEPPEPAAKVIVSESRRCVEAFDASGKMLAHYPASTGSVHDPLPIGTWKILGVARNPVFHYNPALFWDARVNEKATLPPGPNSPVGVCWIDLSRPHYGIHGSPEPSQIGKTQSHGCIRLTNWDVTELSQMVKPGTPAVLER